MVYCSPCDAGTSSDSTTAATACTTCGAGTYSLVGTPCVDCDEGYYQPANGSKLCLRCATEMGRGYWSAEGASECDQASEGFFFNTKDGRPEECPKGIDCGDAGTTTESIVVRKGFYRFSTKFNATWLRDARVSGTRALHLYTSNLGIARDARKAAAFHQRLVQLGICPPGRSSPATSKDLQGHSTYSPDT